jgi:hypothetical protein
MRKWSKGACKNDASEWEAEMLAYLLQHNYSEVNLRMAALKGKDRHMIAHLKAVAEDLGFMVCLGHLEYVERGTAEDYGRRKRGRYYDSDSEESNPPMAGVDEKSLNITSLVNLDGLEMLDGHDLPLREESLMPQNAFKGAYPDDAEYEGYQGNVRSYIKFTYRPIKLIVVCRLLVL